MKRQINAGLTAITIAVTLIAGPAITVSAKQYHRHNAKPARECGWRLWRLWK
jgi:hypothetical protein